MSNYIADGMNIDGYIAAAVPEPSGERLHEELNFTFRPATRQESLKLDGQIKIASQNVDVDPDCYYRIEQLINKLLATKVISWDLRDHMGQPVAISAENLERLNQVLQNKLYQIIRGTRLSDRKPNQPEPKSDEDRVKN